MNSNIIYTLLSLYNKDFNMFKYCTVTDFSNYHVLNLFDNDMNQISKLHISVNIDNYITVNGISDGSELSCLIYNSNAVMNDIICNTVDMCIYDDKLYNEIKRIISSDDLIISFNDTPKKLNRNIFDEIISELNSYDEQ